MVIMLMRISQPKVVTKSGKSRLTAAITLEKEADQHEVRELWFEVDEKYHSYLCDERSDAFLVAMLQYAMRFGYDITCEAPITAELLYNLKFHLVPILCKSSSESWKNPKIIAETSAELLKTAGAVGTGMSCGVDSFHAAFDHRNDSEGQPRLTHLFINSIGSFDANYQKLDQAGPSKEEIKEATFARARRVAESMDLPLIESNSNFYQVYNNDLFSKTHTYATIFSVLALQKLWGIYLFAGAGDYSQFSLYEHDTKDCGWYDLLSLNCFSMRHLRFYSEGGVKTRGKKTIAIANESLAQEELHVCILRTDNCGKCQKCRRTMVTLDAIGKLNDFKNVFPVIYYQKNLDEYLEWLAKGFVKDDVFAIEIYNLFLKNEKYSEILDPMIKDIKNKKYKNSLLYKQKSEIKSLKEQIKKMEKSATKKKDQIDKQKSMINDQKHQLNASKNQIQKMRCSMSWRLTKPLRKVTKMLKRD